MVYAIGGERTNITLDVGGEAELFSVTGAISESR
jgi:hypothetical protein